MRLRGVIDSVRYQQQQPQKESSCGTSNRGIQTGPGAMEVPHTSTKWKESFQRRESNKRMSYRKQKNPKMKESIKKPLYIMAYI